MVAFHELCKCFYGRKDEGAEEPGMDFLHSLFEMFRYLFHLFDFHLSVCRMNPLLNMHGVVVHS